MEQFLVRYPVLALILAIAAGTFSPMRKHLLTVSIVDDEPSVREALVRLLRAQSINTPDFASGADFIRSLQDGLPDCLVVDFHMPEMTGLELQQHLRREGAHIPTVVITAHADVTIRHLCQEAGAKSFLIKPLENAVLVNAIKSAVEDRAE
jgi:FixJ family two-component response regulator